MSSSLVITSIDSDLWDLSLREMYEGLVFIVTGINKVTYLIKIIGNTIVVNASMTFNSPDLQFLSPMRLVESYNRT